jgi:hypothetical protein
MRASILRGFMGLVYADTGETERAIELLFAAHEGYVKAQAKSLDLQTFVQRLDLLQQKRMKR